jgi:uncharacterized protein YwqG
MSTFAERIAATPLRHHAAEILEWVRPAVSLVPTGRAPGALGESRFGGLPDVGPGFRWPRRQRPLSFLLQLDLAGIARFPAAAPLPAAGLLSFFYDATGEPWEIRRSAGSGCRVHYTPPGTLRRVTRLPKGMSPEMVFPAVGLRCELIETLPNSLPFWTDEFDELRRCPDDIYLYDVLDPDPLIVHQLLGYPRPIQDDLGGVASGEPTPWLSLLQLDSDERLEMMWGDAGKLHWLIRAGDLARRDFDHIVLSLQCC